MDCHSLLCPKLPLHHQGLVNVNICDVSILAAAKHSSVSDHVHHLILLA